MAIGKTLATRAVAGGVLALLAVAVVCASWFLTTSNAQSTPDRNLSEDIKLVVETPSGTVVTRSQDKPSAETLAKLRQLVTAYPGKWEIDIAEGHVKNLKPTTAMAVNTSGKDFSRAFLDEFSTLFGITPAEASYVVEFNLRDRRVVEYRQALNQVPVEHSFVTFAVANSRLEQVTSRLYTALNPDTFSVTPNLQRDLACDVATADFRRTVGRGDATELKCKENLVVLPDESNFYLVWKLIVSSSQRLDSYTYYVDAQNGSVLRKYSNLRSQKGNASDQQTRLLSTKEETSGVLRTEQFSPHSGRPDNDPKKEVDIQSLTIPPRQPAPLDVWETILSENFDVNNFPYTPWRAFDNNGATGGELFWDDQNCVSNSPNWSLWPADDGVNHLNPCTDNYVNNMDSWVVYGPFSLANATDGLLEFNYNNVSESGFDHLKWMVSINGTNFYGLQISGNSSGWRHESLDLKNVPTLGNITGQTQVWIAFAFTTDGSVISGKGPFVDDVTIKRLANSSCSGVSGHVNGNIFGRSSSETVLGNLKSTKVVLNNTLAFDSHTVTNTSGDYTSSECSDYIRFELEGFGSRNFVKIRNSQNTANTDGPTPNSGDITFAPRVDYTFNSSNADNDLKRGLTIFWHVNEVHDFFNTLVGQDLMNYQMQAHFNYVDGRNCETIGTTNAFYSLDDNNIYFCSSDLSKESDVIYHEYTHGVIDHIPNYALVLPGQPAAMNEGLADYFATSKNNDPQMNGINRNLTTVVRYDEKCTTDNRCSASVCGVNKYWIGTDYDDGCAHHNSLVVSGALWALRQNPALTPSYVDRLVVDTLILRKPIHYTDLLEGLIAQDGGSNATHIRAAFASRGIFPANSCTYSLQPSSQIFIASASSGSFNVVTTSNCSWTAVSNVSWLTTNSAGTGNGVVNYSVGANTGNSRNGTITVGGQTFTVFQSAGNGNGCPDTTIALGQTINATLTTGCVFTGTSRYVDPYIFNGTAGQQIVIAMSSTAFDTYLFLNSPNNQTIVQDDDGGGGTNSRIPTFAGAFTLPASGTYRIFATSYSADGTSGSTGAYSISLLSSTSCSYSISPASQSVGASSSSNSFSIVAPAGCAWTALNNASWITTNSSGSGNGTINYSVAANSGAARAGTISVGGRIFTVNQAGAQIPASPTANPATNVTTNSFTANWSTGSGASGYRLDVSISNTFNGFISGYNNLDVGNVTNRSVTGLSPNTTYFYRVRAYNSAGTSGNSGTVTVITSTNPPSAPTANAATSITSNSFTANWNSSSGATGYRLDVSTSNSFITFVSGYQNLDVGNVLSRSITGLTNSTLYYYRVRAYNAAGSSANSNTRTLSTLGPMIFIEQGTTNRAAALDAITLLRSPFKVLNFFNFTSDNHTRVMLFTSDLGMTQPNSSQLTVRAGGITLSVENVGPVTGVTGMNASYIVVRLPDGLPTGDLALVVTLRGLASVNSATLAIASSGP
ncbi:MAG TPA: fibronectin type III domain-containing protein [Pyrinomonadaceae bacterium]|nr:fibronectin type III domain-containing protein [Pyrinomonadaceae bacterium]